MNKLKIMLILLSSIAAQVFAQTVWDIKPYETKKLSGELTIGELKVGDSSNSTLQNAICRNMKGFLFANRDARLDGINFRVTKISKDTIDIDFPDRSIPVEDYIKRLILLKADHYCEVLVASNYNKTKNYDMPKNYTYKIRKINGETVISSLLK